MAEDIEEIEEEDLEDRGDLIEDEDEDEEQNLSEDEDEEAEDEDQEAEDEDQEAEDEVEDQEEDIKIPKARLDEVISQREAERERVIWLEEQLETLINQKTPEPSAPQEPDKPTYDYAKAEEEYASLLIDGETSKAAVLRNTIDGERKNELVALIKETRTDTLNEASTKSNEAVEQEKFNTLIGSFENKHSFLNTESDNYNEEAVDTVNTLISGYISSGKTKSQALKIAVSRVVPMYSTKDEPTTKQSLGGTRKVKARRKAAKASNAQPENSQRVKASDNNVDIPVSNMSENQYNKLTLKEKKNLRGD